MKIFKRIQSGVNEKRKILCSICINQIWKRKIPVTNCTQPDVKEEEFLCKIFIQPGSEEESFKCTRPGLNDKRKIWLGKRKISVTKCMQPTFREVDCLALRRWMAISFINQKTENISVSLLAYKWDYIWIAWWKSFNGNDVLQQFFLVCYGTFFLYI